MALSIYVTCMCETFPYSANPNTPNRVYQASEKNGVWHQSRAWILPVCFGYNDPKLKCNVQAFQTLPLLSFPV